MISRRGLIRGMGALLAAPAIVRVASLMPVRSLVVGSRLPGAGDYVWHWQRWLYGTGHWSLALLDGTDTIRRDYLGRLMLGRGEIVPLLSETDEHGLIRRPEYAGVLLA